jgi:hypothetical protein
VYPYSSTQVIEPQAKMLSDTPQDAVEEQVQRILTQLENLAPEIQIAVCSRLLSGLATKLTAAQAKNAIAAAKADQQAPNAKASTRKSAASSKSAKDDVPRADSLLRQLSDPEDPVEAWHRFGGTAAQLFDVLKGEPTGLLEAMLTHRNMPAGPKPRSKSREKLAENIAVRLEQKYRGY